MDKLNQYRRIIQQVLERHAQYRPSHGQIEPMLICDATRDQYVLIDVGWDRTGRVHSVVVHLHLRQGKIWVEWDGTEPSLTHDLLEADGICDRIALMERGTMMAVGGVREVLGRRLTAGG